MKWKPVEQKRTNCAAVVCAWDQIVQQDKKQRREKVADKAKTAGA